MTPEQALAALSAQADPVRAEQMRAYHKVDRPYLGLSNGQISALATEWRKSLPLADCVALSDALWSSNIFEARIACGKLFLQARIRPDDALAWEAISRFLPDFDSWAIADAVAQAGTKRLLQNPARLDEIEGWTDSKHLWTRRAALVFTLCYTKSRFPNPMNWLPATGSLAGARAMSMTKIGLSKKPLRGGCAISPARMRRAPAPSLKSMARV